MESLAILPPDTGEERSDLKQTSKTRTRLRTVDLAYAALFAVLLMVCALDQHSPDSAVHAPDLLALLQLGTLGGRRGTLAILAYLLLGLVGLPVFSGFQGGPGVLLGTTGGYILGFLPRPCCIGA